MSARPVVAGAGIGGLALALALARRGVAVLVLERRPALDPGGLADEGAGIQVSPNASRALVALGLLPRLAPLATAPAALVMRREARAAPLAALPLASLAARFGAPYLALRRADLLAALLDALAAEPLAELRLNAGLAEARDEGDAVGLRLEGGGALTAPALVGADGLWSAARAALGGPPAAFQRAEALRALVPAADAPAFAREALVNLWMGPARHAVHYPVAGGRLVNVVLARAAPAPRPGWSREAAPPALPGAAPELAALLAAAPAWRAWSLFARPAGPMARGRVALLGDAAHPVLPFLAQGGALAIEDAAVLAPLLAEGLARGAVAPALLAYDAARRRRAARVQAASARNGRLYHLKGPAALARDLALARLPPARLLGALDWLYGWRPPA